MEKFDQFRGTQGSILSVSAAQTESQNRFESDAIEPAG